MLLFALGLTPKQVLHDALTNHDHITTIQDGIGDWVGKNRFNCDDENFVAHSPFLPTEVPSVTFPYLSYRIDVKFLLNSYSHRHTFFSLQRGPPSNC